MPQDLSKLDSDFHKSIKEIILDAQKKYPDYVWKITSAYRSPEEQTKLYQQGRRGIKGEKIVTKTKNSSHSSGLAVDIYPLSKGKIPKYEEAKEAYDYFGQSAKSKGLIWGGDWKMGDFGHIERKPKLKNK